MTSYCIISFCRFPTPLWPPPIPHVLILTFLLDLARCSRSLADVLDFIYVSISHDTCILILVRGCRPPYSASPPLFPPCLRLTFCVSQTHIGVSLYHWLYHLWFVACLNVWFCVSRVLRDVLTLVPPLFTTFEAPCGNLCALCGSVVVVGRTSSICTTWRRLSVCYCTFQTRFCEKVGTCAHFLNGFRKIVIVHLKFANPSGVTAAGIYWPNQPQD